MTQRGKWISGSLFGSSVLLSRERLLRPQLAGLSLQLYRCVFTESGVGKFFPLAPNRREQTHEHFVLLGQNDN